MAHQTAAASSSGTVLGRFARYCGKVNIHQSAGGAWTSDADCSSGCNLGGLSYCQKFWPATTSVRQVAVTAKPNNVWNTGGCGAIVDDYDGNDEFECVAGPYCGDNSCNPAQGETPSSCPTDCGTCGDGVCSGTENPLWCANDCGIASTCGDGRCNNGETAATCASDCRAPTLVTNTNFPSGVLQFPTEEDFNSLYHTLSANPSAANTLPNGFGSLKAHLSQFPANETTYEVDRAEYLRDMKAHVVDDDALQALVNPELQVIAGGKLYQFTDIGLFKVDMAQLASFKSWFATNQESIAFDPNYKTVPGETALGNDAYQVAPGIVRLDIKSEKMAGSDRTPQYVLGRISRWCGKVNIHQNAGGAWSADSDCSSGCNLGGVEYCQKFWPNATAIRPVTVSAKPNNVWNISGCQAVVNDYDGEDEFECLSDGPPPPYCGDGYCNGGETPATCTNDCGTSTCGGTQPTMALYGVDSGFNKAETKEFGGNRRFMFKAKNLDLLLYRAIYIKGKLQRRKKFLGIKYWGPSYADEIIVGCDNMDLHTDLVLIPPPTSQFPRPNFTKLFNFKLGNHVFEAMDVDVHNSLLGRWLNQSDVNRFVDSQFNQIVGGVFNNYWTQIENSFISSIDSTYPTRYAAYTKKINSWNEANHLRWSFGKVEKAKGYSHENHWQWDWNTAFGKSTYSYEMRSGSFFGKARVGCDWYGIRIVRQ
ncbi:hypothetical protein F0U60_12560 [Archangium minus]|uniref:Uncharacterized protein n=1 Tax=Archangium minus TaxID=83450 RepID=A0ABY9WQ30_9BACT|nr:hypothetical protein F0U60_12560 [Archangium minus]